MKARSIYLNVVLICIALVIISIIIYTNQKHIDELNSNIATLQEENTTIMKERDLYKDLSETCESDNVNLKKKLQESYVKISDLENQLKLAKEELDKYNLKIKNNKNKPVVNQDLSIFEIPTETELNEWIKEKAPSDSPFIGRADIFLEASYKSGLSPKYIIAHAAVESSWGKSNICKNKGNYFGIAVYNHNTNAGYTFVNSNTKDKLKTGIIEGAIWISNNYTRKGQNTIHTMIYGPKTYAVYDDGSPNIGWIDQISQIMS